MSSVRPGSVEDVFVLSPLQLGMLFQTRLAPDSGVFYQQLATPLPGHVDDDAFQLAWSDLIAATPALRTSFHWDDLEHPVQVVHRDVEFSVNRLDWSRTSTRQVRARLDRHLADKRTAGFDLECAPLMEVELVTMPGRQRWFLWHFHHLLLDGWSSRLVMDEFVGRYTAHVAGEPFRATIRPFFRTYIEWLQRQDEHEAERFWRAELLGVTNPTTLNVPRPPPDRVARTEEVVELSVDATSALIAFGREGRVTLNTVLQGAWAILLSRYAGTDDVVFGSVVSGRTPQLPGVEEIVGLFINSLPTRVFVDDDLPLTPWLRALQSAQSTAMQYDYVSPMQISQWSELPAATRLYDTVLIFENFPRATIEDRTAMSGTAPLDFGQTDLPLSLLVLPGTQLRLTLRNDGETVGPEVLRRIADDLAALLEQLPAMGDRTLGSISLMGEDDLAPIADVELGGDRDGRAAKSVVEMFDAQVQRSPDMVPFFESGRDDITLAALAGQVERLAAHLATCGMAVGDVVGVNLARSVDAVAAVLAIFDIGAVYLPLDPAYPQARIEYMIRDSHAVCVIGRRPYDGVMLVDPEQAWTDGVVDVDCVRLTRGQRHRPSPDDLAYVLYTSGSTGTPKGVAVEHRVVLNRLWWMWRTYGFGPDDVCSMRTSSNFVDALWEMLGGVLRGVPTVIASDDDVADPALLLDLCRVHDVTRLFLVPSYLSALLERCPDVQDRAPSLRWWFVGGEPLTDDLARRFHRSVPHGELHNIYGSTELWDATAFAVGPESLGRGRVSIGRPIDNVEVVILDAHGRRVPRCVIGRMCVGGAALPRGYLDETLNRQRFTVTTDGLAARVFDTGDLAHVEPDGSIHLHGRGDAQVKVRGQRIEPGEIEAVLEGHPHVAAAAAVVTGATRSSPTDDGHDGRLVAYLVASGDRCAERDLRSLVAERLPRQMMPSHFVWVDELPRTPSGKKDRLALSERPLQRVSIEVPSADHDGLARRIACVMTELLALGEVHPDDHFFADLGGHSLLAVRLCSRLEAALGVAVPVRDVFDHPTVALLAAHLAALVTVGSDDDDVELEPLRVIAAERDPIGDFPLSYSQERLWFLDQLSPGNSSYHLSFANGFGGPIDRGCIERALSQLVVRHEGLRTTFPTSGDEPVQRVGVARPVTCDVVDLGHIRPRRRAAETARYAARFAAEPFELATGPLFRCALVRLGEQGDVLVFVIHHIVADGWSIEVLFSELADLYRSELTGSAPSLAAPGPQYVDYTLWQRRQLTGDTLAALADFWRRALDGAPTLDLPTDRPRPRLQSWRGAHVYFEPPPELVERVRATSRAAGTTPFTVLLANFLVVLQQYTGQDDLVVGTPVANRASGELDGIVGFFVNSVVLRSDLSGDPTFLDIVGRTHAMIMDAREHQDLPFSKLVSMLDIEQDLSRNPLFQVSFQLLASHDAERGRRADRGGIDVEVETGTAVFDLALNIVDQGQRLRSQFEYNTDLFDESTIVSMSDHFLTSLDRLSAAPDRPLSSLSMLTDSEVERLRGWECGPVDPPSDEPITTAIARQAARTPDAVAVSDGRSSLGYRQLVDRADRAAAALHQRWGSGGAIAVMMPPTVDLITALLAILRSGNTYVPIDRATPVERVANMLADADVSAVIVAPESELMVAPGVDVVVLDGERLDGVEESAIDLPDIDVNASAYIVFTSGSTGRPKGVAVSHRSLANYIAWCAQTYPVAHGVGAPLASSIAADMAVTTYFTPLVTGTTVFLLDDSDIVTSLDDALRGQDRFSFVKVTPSHLDALRQLAIGRGAPANTCAFVVGGEELRGETTALWREEAPEILIWNEYGPTEATVACCAHVAPAGSIGDGPVPIGRPISNAVLEVVDRHGRRAPCGVTGELQIGGIGVATGYVGDHELTAERFGSPPDRRYRSGDLVRRDRDGLLHFLGRADRQLKIRGHRVEPGEIESVIVRHPAVERCVVVAKELRHDDRRLVAFVVATDPPPTLRDELAAMLRTDVPAVMIPSRFEIVDEIPMTRSGKIHVDALLGVATTPQRASRPHTPPRSDLDQALLAVFHDVLGIHGTNGAEIGIHADFFGELGGDSLLATKAVARIREYLQHDLPLRLVFEHPSVASLADAMNAACDDPSLIGRRATALVEVLAMTDEEIDAVLVSPGEGPERCA